VLDRPDPVARRPDDVNVDREVPEDRDAETAGFRLRREEHVRRDETDLDEVGPGDCRSNLSIRLYVHAFAGHCDDKTLVSEDLECTCDGAAS
jgi:hypothetical protein